MCPTGFRCASLDVRLNATRSARVRGGYLTCHARGAATDRLPVSCGRNEVETHPEWPAMFSPFQASTVAWSTDAAEFVIKLPRAQLEAQLSALLHDVVTRPLRFELRVPLSERTGCGLLDAAAFFAEQLATDSAAGTELLRARGSPFCSPRC
nr:hypothetical protein [Amycolatopsis sp. ATCC 39116]